MTLFLLGALLLALLVSGVLLWGRGAGPRPADLDDPNLSWYRQRQGELAGSDDRALLDDVRLRLVEEGAVGNTVGNAMDSALSGAAGGGDGMPVRGADPGFVRHRFTALLLLVLVVLTGLIYTRTGALEDVLIYRDLESLRPGDRPAVEALARRVEGRLAAQPEATQYLGLLGQLQLAAEDLSAAADSYARLAAAYPDDPTAQAQAAQTRFLAAGRRLDSEAQLLAERALALDPQQGTALGLLGMAAFESGQFNAAINYWERLLRLEAPGSEGYRMLSSVLDIARQRAGVPAVAAAGSAATTGGDAAMSPGIRVDLSLPDGAQITPESTVFVFARRDGAASRMPIAVRRLTASELPVTVRLSDADTMAGQVLSDAGDVMVSAQLSRNGQPGAANAAYLGSAGPVRAGSDTAVVIELQAARAGS
jgi:cytochrome c-type biogenesis protein CcmH